MTKSIWQEACLNIENKDLAFDLTLEKEFDFIIVGAGIAGLSTAYWLEKKYSNIRIAILDKNSIGSGASGKNAGFVTCGSIEHFYKLQDQFGLEKAIEIWRFSEENKKLLLEEIIQDQAPAVDFEETGSCTIAIDIDDWQRYNQLNQTMSEAGIKTTMVDSNFLKNNYGILNSCGGVYNKQDGQIHPIKLLEQIKSKLKNTKFILNNPLTRFYQQANRWVVSAHQTLSSKYLIICLNGYISEQLPELHNLIKPQRGQVIVTEPTTKFIKGPCYLPKYLCYFRQLPTQEILVGGFRNQDLAGENTAEDNISEIIQNALSDFIKTYFHQTKNLKLMHRWSGIMGFTPDGQMLIGQHPQKENLYIMAGCSGHGLSLSFHAAKTLVNSIENLPIPGHLNIQRFLK